MSSVKRSTAGPVGPVPRHELGFDPKTTFSRITNAGLQTARKVE